MAIEKDKIIASAAKLVQKGQYAKALKEYQRLLAAEPNDERTLQKVADLYLRMDDTKNAVSVYNRVAELYAQNGFFNKAIAVYRQLLNLTPNNFDLHLRLADLYKSIGLMAETVAEYQKVVDAFESQGMTRDALEVMRRIVDLDPTNIGNRIKLAEGYLGIQDLDTARREFRRVIEYLRDNRLDDDYLRLLDRYAQVFPDDKASVIELTRLLAARNEFRRALGRLQTALKHYPDDVDVLDLLANVFRRMEQPQKAVTVMRELARLHADAGATAEQVRVLKTILEIVPDDEDAVAELADLGIEGFGGRIEELGGAEELLIEDGFDDGPQEEIIEFEAPVDEAGIPRPSPAQLAQVEKLIGEAQVFVRYGMFGQAEERLTQAIEITPYSTDVMAAWRDLYLKREQWEEASRTSLQIARLRLPYEGIPGVVLALEEAVELLPDDRALPRLRRHIETLDERSAEALLDDFIASEDALEAVAEAMLPADTARGGPRSLSSLPAAAFTPVDLGQPSGRAPDEEEPLILLEDEGPVEAPSSRRSMPAVPADEETDFSGLDDAAPPVTPPTRAAIPALGARPGERGAPRSTARLEAARKEPVDPLPRDIRAAEKLIKDGQVDAGLAALARLLVHHPDDPRVADAMERGERRAALAQKQAARAERVKKARAERVPLDLDALVSGAIADESVNLADALLDDEDLAGSDWSPPGGGLNARSGPDDRDDPVAFLAAFQTGRLDAIDETAYESHWELAQSYRAQGLFDEAVQSLRACAAYPDGAFTALVALAVTYALKGDLAGAGLFARMAGRLPEGRGRLRAALHYDAGRVYADRDDADAALLHMQRVVDLAPEYEDAAARAAELEAVGAAAAAAEPVDAWIDTLG